MNLAHVLEGIKNDLFPSEEDRQFIEDMVKRRFAICSGCQYMSENVKPKPLRPDAHCTICHCTMRFKLKSPSTSCPLNYWTNETKDS